MVKSMDMIQSPPVKIFRWFSRLLRLAGMILVCTPLLTYSNAEPNDQTERVRAFTRDIEFDYVGWTMGALRIKLFESALSTGNYLPTEIRRRLVTEYLQWVGDIRQIEMQIALTYTDPGITDPKTASIHLRERLDELQSYRKTLAPTAEAILQSQISYVASQVDLTLAGQAVPPVLYHATPLPLALIVSPRNLIRQDEDISLIPDLTVDTRTDLEQHVDETLDVSSLVVEIGGVGTYPTMVEQTNSLDWLCEVISHEWVHNYLTLRPLGINYMTSPELRIMNETAASIAGKEMGRLVLEEFYPELLPPLPSHGQESQPTEPTKPPAFDFRHEMHITRVQVDKLLEEGKISEAEGYMEMRRKIFWENGYGIRKLNQAYFAFYGAYADEPGGAAGAIEDPVGSAVRDLRARSPSLAAFINRISWMVSFEQLKGTIDS
jgi:hypothetical protein